MNLNKLHWKSKLIFCVFNIENFVRGTNELWVKFQIFTYQKFVKFYNKRNFWNFNNQKFHCLRSVSTNNCGTRKKGLRKNGLWKNGPRKMVPWKKISEKIVPREMVPEKMSSKNCSSSEECWEVWTTVLFLSIDHSSWDHFSGVQFVYN